MSDKKDRYIYPAVFNYADDGISIDFPDLPGCVTCAFALDEALHNAREALELYMFNVEDNCEAIPEPSDILKLRKKLRVNQILVPIEANMIIARDSINNKAINKMCTLPQWLVSASLEADINFSHTLQDALMDKLGIHREIKRRNRSHKD